MAEAAFFADPDYPVPGHGRTWFATTRDGAALRFAPVIQIPVAARPFARPAPRCAYFKFTPRSHWCARSHCMGGSFGCAFALVFSFRSLAWVPV